MDISTSLLVTIIKCKWLCTNGSHVRSIGTGVADHYTSTDRAHRWTVSAHHLHLMIVTISDVDISISTAHTQRLIELAAEGCYTSAPDQGVGKRMSPAFSPSTSRHVSNAIRGHLRKKDLSLLRVWGCNRDRSGFSPKYSSTSSWINGASYLVCSFT